MTSSGDIIHDNAKFASQWRTGSDCGTEVHTSYSSACKQSLEHEELAKQICSQMNTG